MTLTASDRVEWLKARRLGIGGSDVAAIAGLHPYKSAWSVYWDKVLDSPDDGVGEAARWGQLLEAAVADEWARRHYAGMVEPGLIVDAAHPWRRGTPDRLAYGELMPKAGALEVKLAGPEAWRFQWDGGATIPAWYQAQAQWYLGLTDLDVCYFAVLVEGRRLEERTLDRDDDVIARLRRLADAFWYDHVLPARPPLADGGPRTRGELDDRYPPPVELPAVCVLHDYANDLIDEYRASAREVKAWEEKKTQAGNRLIAMLGDHGATDGYLASEDGVAAPAVTYRSTREVDWDAVEKEHGTDTLEPALRFSYNTKAVEKLIGRKALDAHRRPSDKRRLYVRGDD